MGLYILIILTFSIFIIDRRLYGTVFTPSILLSIPFLIICLLYGRYAEELGYYPLSYSVLYIWNIGLFFFWLIGILTSQTIKLRSPISNSDENSKLLYIQRYNKLLLNFVFVLALASLYVVKQAYEIFIVSGGEEVESFLGKGIQGHIVLVIKFLSILSFVTLFTKLSLIDRFKHLYIVFIALVLSVMYGTKGNILILVLSYYLIWSVFFEKRPKLYHLVTALFLGFGIFMLSYSMIFGYVAPLDFIWNHMIMYYVSGTASMNAYFANNGVEGIEPEMLFRSIFNLVYLITGSTQDIKNTISDEWTFIGNGTIINVKTFFGTIYLYGGLGWGLFAVCVFSFFSHLFVVLAGRSRNNIVTLSFYTYLLAIYCFGWFDFYLNTIAIIEYTFIVVFLNVILSKIK